MQKVPNIYLLIYLFWLKRLHENKQSSESNQPLSITQPYMSQYGRGRRKSVNETSQTSGRCSVQTQALIRQKMADVHLFPNVANAGLVPSL